MPLYHSSLSDFLSSKPFLFLAELDRPPGEPALPGLRGAGCRIPLWRLYLRGMQIFLRPVLQQSVRYTGKTKSLKILKIILHKSAN